MPSRDLAGAILKALEGGPLDTLQLAAKIEVFPWDVQAVARRLLKRNRLLILGKRTARPFPNIWQINTEAAMLPKSQEGPPC